MAETISSSFFSPCLFVINEICKSPLHFHTPSPFHENNDQHFVAHALNNTGKGVTGWSEFMRVPNQPTSYLSLTDFRKHFIQCHSRSFSPSIIHFLAYLFFLCLSFSVSVYFPFSLSLSSSLYFWLLFILYLFVSFSLSFSLSYFIFIYLYAFFNQPYLFICLTISIFSCLSLPFSLSLSLSPPLAPGLSLSDSCSCICVTTLLRHTRKTAKDFL